MNLSMISSMRWSKCGARRRRNWPIASPRQKSEGIPRVDLCALRLGRLGLVKNSSVQHKLLNERGVLVAPAGYAQGYPRRLGITASRGRLARPGHGAEAGTARKTAICVELIAMGALT